MTRDAWIPSSPHLVRSLSSAQGDAVLQALIRGPGRREEVGQKVVLETAGEQGWNIDSPGFGESEGIGAAPVPAPSGSRARGRPGVSSRGGLLFGVGGVGSAGGTGEEEEEVEEEEGDKSGSDHQQQPGNAHQ
ncbi:hypothetical protein FQA47_014085, partial [Oryzias melastigma]